MDSAEDDHLGLDEDEDEEEEEEGDEGHNLHLLHSSNSSQLIPLQLHPPRREEEVADNHLFIQPTGALTQVRPIAVVSVAITMESTPDPKRQDLETLPIDGEEEEEEKPLAMLDESRQRRLFQRLWTDEDEIQLLLGFLHYTSQRGFTVGNSSSTNHQDTTMFYDQVRSKLQLNVNKNQLVRKLRRMKKKYRTVEGKISSGKKYNFKSPHEQATFEISRRIWRENEVHSSNGGKVRFQSNETNGAADINNSQGKISEQSRKRARTMNLVEIPAPVPSPSPIQALPQTSVVGSMVLNSIPFGLLNVFADIDDKKNKMEDKWKQQQILELEAYSKRLDLIQDQIKYALQVLTSM